MIFVDTSNNLVVGNNLTSDASYETGYSSPGGMYFDHSSNNTIYHNNFEISIGGEALDSYYGSSNVWDDGFPFGGNYWTDYQKLHPNATEIDSSGIGNMPYVIDGPDNNSTNLNNTDRYPLIRQFTSTFSALQTTAPKITILSPVNQTFNESNVILSFSVDVLSPVKSIDWIGYSINGGLNVTVTNNSPIINVTIPNVTVGLNVLTVYANDSYGNSADPQTINFTVTKPVTPTIITLAVVLLISTTVIAGTGLTIFFKKRKKQAQKLYK